MKKGKTCSTTPEPKYDSRRPLNGAEGIEFADRCPSHMWIDVGIHSPCIP
jgi:hypothetical protein